MYLQNVYADVGGGSRLVINPQPHVINYLPVVLGGAAVTALIILSIFLLAKLFNRK